MFIVELNVSGTDRCSVTFRWPIVEHANDTCDVVTHNASVIDYVVMEVERNARVYL